MRCKKLIAVLLTAAFLLGSAVTTNAGDGRRKTLVEIDAICNDHPWQDESGKSEGGKSAKKLFGFVIGPLTFTVNVTVPFTQKPSQAPQKPANSTTTQTSVEKGK